MFNRKLEMNARMPTAKPELFVLNAEQPIGQIAIHLPGSTAVLRRLKLDFCCGGQISLRQATEDKGLDLQIVLDELAALQRADTSSEMADPATLINHILERYHAVHRDQLPELIRMAKRVEAVHRDHPEVPTGLAELLVQAEQYLLRHMNEEESAVFPLLIAGGGVKAKQFIDVLRAEHTDHGAMLMQMLALTHNATPPEGACNTWRALYSGIAQFHGDLSNHIHLENNLLFRQFDMVLPVPAPSTCCGSCC
jgi:regulator of cell morphogenesis and NO signaling